MKHKEPTKYNINYSKRDLLEAEKNQYLLRWVHENHPDVVKKCDKVIKEILKTSQDAKK